MDIKRENRVNKIGELYKKYGEETVLAKVDCLKDDDQSMFEMYYGLNGKTSASIDSGASSSDFFLNSFTAFCVGTS